MSGDEDAVAATICSRAWDDIQAIDGGFSEARQATLQGLPGPRESIITLRGREDRAVLEVKLVNGDRVPLDLPVIWVEDQPRFCPQRADELLGSPRGQ